MATIKKKKPKNSEKKKCWQGLERLRVFRNITRYSPVKTLCLNGVLNIEDSQKEASLSNVKNWCLDFLRTACSLLPSSSCVFGSPQPPFLGEVQPSVTSQTLPSPSSHPLLLWHCNIIPTFFPISVSTMGLCALVEEGLHLFCVPGPATWKALSTSWSSDWLSQLDRTIPILKDQRFSMEGGWTPPPPPLYTHRDTWQCLETFDCHN